MIEFKNVQIKYGDFIAIDNLNLKIEEGEFFTFLGPSGCGKTTTLRSLAGFITPSLGKIYMNGIEVTDLPIEKRELGIVFQSYALFPSMTVFENIAFGLKVDKKSKEYIKKRVENLAKLVDLNASQLSKNVSDLSGGQQQRVAIARALAKQPSVIAFDEPLSNLDAKLRKQLRGELKSISQKSQMTAVYVTHDQEEALMLSDRIAVFNQGKIEQIGTPSEIYDQPQTEFVCNFIGDANKLSKAILTDINNQQSETKLKLNANSYIRVEKIKSASTTNSNHEVKLEVIIVDKEYYGSNSLYSYKYGDCVLKSFVKEDGMFSASIGEKTQIYINIDDILQYEAE